MIIMWISLRHVIHKTITSSELDFYSKDVLVTTAKNRGKNCNVKKEGRVNFPSITLIYFQTRKAQDTCVAKCLPELIKYFFLDQSTMTHFILILSYGLEQIGNPLICYTLTSASSRTTLELDSPLMSFGLELSLSVKQPHYEEHAIPFHIHWIPQRRHEIYSITLNLKHPLLNNLAI